jgi:hypothetical protein
VKDGRGTGLRAGETADETAVLTAHGDDRALVVLHTWPRNTSRSAWRITS